MTNESTFAGCAERLKQFMTRSLAAPSSSPLEADLEFNALAIEWFGIQCEHNAAYQRWCRGTGVEPGKVVDWRQIPAMPTSAFKELDITCLPPGERTHVFHSSGTTEQRPSRHFHSDESLALYEASLLNWFRHCVASDGMEKFQLVSLTPPADAAPHSSLIHMLETLRRVESAPGSAFFGVLNTDGAWDLNATVLEETLRAAVMPVLLVGTAFSYVNWMDGLLARGERLRLPAGSRVLETGGYKGRSRSLPKGELHALIQDRLGVSSDAIVCEYGMSELSSQAYDVSGGFVSERRVFQFPPWARVIIVSPENGREVRDGEIGLVRVVDLANLWSVAAVQTEDLAVRRGHGFELLGRAAMAEARGCSLMSR